MQDGSLLSPSERPFHISKGLSLTKKMLGRVPRLRPTAGGVLYSKWLEEINFDAKKLIIF
uniref:Transcriptional regulator n=1 Tax=Heterorhabditis bacteriophora TaxID=37862 RepID=A0A1I7WMD5_HETBA